VDRAALLQATTRYGFALNIVEADGPEMLVQSFLSLKGRADIVWCPPEHALYNRATVRALILASLRNRVPIVGFSSGFTQAGTAAGIFPDFEAVGRQTAQVVKEYLSEKRPQSEQLAQGVRIAVNERVLRLLGISYAKPEDSSGRIEVFK
jgi:ABC-type uncharacterized transport system substrate-binding protein